MVYNYDDFKNFCGVYIVRNIANNFVYVGSTAKDFNSRKRDHFSRMRNGRHTKSVQHDCDKYGIENFVFEIVFISDSIEVIKNEEIRLIEYYKNLGLCYNVFSGGETVGCKASESTRKKQSEYHKKQIIGEYQRKVISETNKNRVMSQETKDKLSKMFQGSKSSLSILNEDEVYEIKTELVNGSPMEDLAKKYNVTIACINNIRKEYRWSHVVVDGWKEYQSTFKRWHKLTTEDELDIVKYIESGKNNWFIHNKYGISYDKIKSLREKHGI